MTLKVFTAFSGYDSQCMALDRMKINYELVGWSEIDKYAIMAHNAIYPQYKDRNFGDISKIDWENVPDFDLFTYSFPCTDISSAGQQKGLEEGSGTRSGLLWECKKAIELKRPKYLLMENVKALTQKKFLPYLHKWHSFLTEKGYTNFTQILNSKNFGVPQNRERVFMVSILGDAWFDFPKPFQSDKKLKDLLDENVDDRYYLSQRCLSSFIRKNEIQREKGNGFTFKPTNGDCIAKTILTHPNDRLDDNYIIEPLEPNVLTPKRTEYEKKMRKAYENGDFKESRHNMTILEPRTDGISNTITTVQKDNLLYEPINNKYFRIRKLTEKECFRLMDVSDENINKIQNSGISKTQQYKMAGNSIVVNVLYFIFKNLFKQ